MAVIKCKMCGGELNITPDSTICECEYCGSKQTIPNTDDEKRLRLYERANKLRFECEFDKASGVYESIVSEFQDEAEAYWGLVLCKYGIEYVDDPKTGKKIPTCHRSSFDSVFDDENFDRVMENADAIARGVYREEAKQIEELRKGIIEVSSKEEAYDIFICYKETADDGQRTIDSVIAQDVYDALVEKDYRVFFSRITLEDKLGVEYEPYIFAALNSAKVMLAFGTSYDYYNAVWVKNEWSRFLQLMESGQKKTLVPCYKDIDAYDMPKEFAKLQAQDMGKVGAIQDLLRGIDKIFGKDKKQERINDTSGVLADDGSALTKRGYFSLEEDDVEKAENYFDQALNKNAENSEAYIGLFLIDIRCFKNFKNCKSLDGFLESLIADLDNVSSNKLAACKSNNERIERIAKENRIDNYLNRIDIIKQFEFDFKYDSFLNGLESYKEFWENQFLENNNWKRAESFAKGSFAETISSTKQRFFDEIDSRIEKAKDQDLIKEERVKKEYEAFVDNKEKEIKTQKKEAEAKREEDYKSYCKKYENSTSEDEYSDLIIYFGRMVDYKESREKIADCKTRIEEIKRIEKKKKEIEVEKQEKERELKKKKTKKIIIGVSIAAALVVIGVIGYSIYKKKVIIPKQKYEEAGSLMDETKYEDAIKVYEELGDYEDSKSKIEECNKMIADAKEAAEKAEQEKKKQAEEKKLEEVKEKADAGDIEEAINLSSGISVEDVKSEALNYIVEKVKESLEELTPTKNLGLNKVHENIELLEGVADNEVVESLKSEYNKKSYTIMMKKEIVYNGGWDAFRYETYTEVTMQNYIDLFFDNGDYKEEKELIGHVIDICSSAVNNYYYSPKDSISLSVNYDEKSHLFEVYCIGNSFEYGYWEKPYYLIKVYNDRLIIGDTPESGTVEITNYGACNKLSVPVEESAVILECE